ncbi:hypothetical protein RND81_09G155200 [Saponaria officinalis]|uniref:Syntaxin 6/10/61 N-terminal domain-containing protein n=1 Tax=Saponaria officinalis TaxID=3572 RepID=A0AAW1IL47_SAPOF
MLVANSFDSWQRDAFFSAAEEVQESADILESAYRTWVSAKRDGISSNDLEELRRELQTSLGTAKWQLEEFERAVTSSYGNCSDQNSMSRHQQFIAAIESQISRAEDALRKSFNEGGKEQFRWVNLNEDERDDLAMFLSGISETPTKSTKDETTRHSFSAEREITCKKQDLDCGACSSSYSVGSNIPRKGLISSQDETVINIGQPDCIMERSAKEASTTRVNVNCESDRIRSVKRAHSFSNFGSLSISIPGEDDQTQTLIHGVEDTPKDRGSRFSRLLHFRVINCINQSIRRSGGLNTKMQFSRQLQSGPSIRLIIVLIVSFFLLVPYLLR